MWYSDDIMALRSLPKSHPFLALKKHKKFNGIVFYICSSFKEKTPYDLVKSVNDPVKTNILQQLQQNPKANYSELAEKSGCSTATIKRHVQELKKLGLIERIGSDKTGYWKIVNK